MDYSRKQREITHRNKQKTEVSKDRGLTIFIVKKTYHKNVQIQAEYSQHLIVQIQFTRSAVKYLSNIKAKS